MSIFNRFFGDKKNILDDKGELERLLKLEAKYDLAFKSLKSLILKIALLKCTSGIKVGHEFPKSEKNDDDTFINGVWKICWSKMESELHALGVNFLVLTGYHNVVDENRVYQGYVSYFRIYASASNDNINE